MALWGKLPACLWRQENGHISCCYLLHHYCRRIFSVLDAWSRHLSLSCVVVAKQFGSDPGVPEALQSPWYLLLNRTFRRSQLAFLLTVVVLVRSLRKLMLHPDYSSHKLHEEHHTCRKVEGEVRMFAFWGCVCSLLPYWVSLSCPNMADIPGVHTKTLIYPRCIPQLTFNIPFIVLSSVVTQYSQGCWWVIVYFFIIAKFDILVGWSWRSVVWFSMIYPFNVDLRLHSSCHMLWICLTFPLWIFPCQISKNVLMA